MRYKGIEYPITKSPRGYFHNTDDVSQIKSSLASIILTEPNERIFEPTFGVPLNKVNLNAPVEMVRSEIRMKVAVGIKRWEKRVQVTDIKVNLFEDETYNVLVAKIEVLFIDPINTKTIHSLLLHKSLGGLDGRPMPF